MQKMAELYADKAKCIQNGYVLLLSFSQGLFVTLLSVVVGLFISTKIEISSSGVDANVHMGSVTQSLNLESFWLITILVIVVFSMAVAIIYLRLKYREYNVKCMTLNLIRLSEQYISTQKYTNIDLSKPETWKSIFEHSQEMTQYDDSEKIVCVLCGHYSEYETQILDGCNYKVNEKYA